MGGFIGDSSSGGFVGLEKFCWLLVARFLQLMENGGGVLCVFGKVANFRLSR